MTRKKKDEIVVTMTEVLSTAHTLRLYDWIRNHQNELNAGLLSVEEVAEMAADDLDFEVPVPELHDVLQAAPGLTAKFRKPAAKPAKPRKIDQDYVANMAVKLSRLEDRVRVIEEEFFGAARGK